MAGAPVSRAALAGKKVAITGRLGSMTRPQAVRWIQERGGEYARFPDDATELLVVGGAGWPLRRDGRVTRALEAAEALQRRGGPIRVVSEEEFLSLVGEDRENGVRRLYTAEQLSRILSIPLSLLRTWIRARLVRPVRTEHRLAYFDFEQVASAKVLVRLARSGVTSPRIRRSLELLRRWFPDAEKSLAQLGILEEGGRLLVRLEGGQLAEPSGQLQLDFEETGGEESPADEGQASLEIHWFEEAVRAEEAGALEDAVQAYHRALLGQPPQPEICFNLGNVLYQMGRKDAAAQRLLQAVEIDPDYVEAWNNLGNVLAEQDRAPEAVRAYQSALAVEPCYADAHYNLAESLELLGHREEAEEHWRRYLELDPHSSWARQVRARLEAPPLNDGTPS